MTSRNRLVILQGIVIETFKVGSLLFLKKVLGRIFRSNGVGFFIRFAAMAALSFVSLTSVIGEEMHDAWIAPARAVRKINPVPVDAESLAQGKTLFEQACVACHGAAGKGDGPAAGTLQRNGASIRPHDLSDPQMRQEADGSLFWKISEGKTPMPTFQQIFSEEQIWKLVNYIRTLATKESSTEEATKDRSKQ